MSVVVDVTGLEDMADKLGDLSDIIEDYLQTAVIPQLEAEAASQRQVRTGTYADTWDVDSTDTEVDVTTEAEYWLFLEYGTSRGIKPKPVVGTIAATIGPDLARYIQEGISLG